MWEEVLFVLVPFQNFSHIHCIHVSDSGPLGLLFEEGDPRDIFCLALDPPLGRYGKNILMHVPGHEQFIPTKFRKHPLRGSVVKADYVFQYIYMH